MSRYSISDLENLTGIKAHTIRIWEQRYNILTPQRTDSNIRYYNDNQLRHLLNVSTLLDGGWKISKISHLNQKEINQAIDEATQDSSVTDLAITASINQLIAAGLEYNEALFEKAFSSALIRFGLKETYIKVIHPTLIKIGLMWGKVELIPTQEHFISNLIRQKLACAIDGTYSPPSSEKTWILFLPENETHEIGLMFAHYMIRSQGQRVIYLGQRVPYENLKSVVKSTNPEYIQFFMVRHQDQKVIETLINTLSEDFPAITKVACGVSPSISESISLPNTTFVNRIEEFTSLFD
ncbi:MAG: MerR family transcriptional regulator [Flavobacteriales bacterium]|nr:MerR family transcriptional regulator [Flavobacteriales bacterium]